MALTEAGIHALNTAWKVNAAVLVDVRCLNPKCRAKLAEKLAGTLVVTCRKCGLEQTITVARQ